jgi:phosphate transport system substrate-binding protein
VVKLFKGVFRKGSIIVCSVILALSVTACGNKGQDQEKGAKKEDNKDKAPQSALAGEIKIDGSSTVYPVSQAVAEEFMKEHKGVSVTVNLSGSSNGLKKLINGEIDIADSSRKIKNQEVAALQEKNQEAVEMAVAFDGITVVINPANDWAKEMTVAELKKIWQKGSTVTKWSDVRPEWPSEKINLYGPGTASGTFEYFTEEINGEAKVSREDFQPSEDDNVLVTGVSGDKFAMGYFGYSYFIENKNKIKAVAIKMDEKSPAVMPTAETIEDGSYKPLSRPIYIYPTKTALARPEVKEFIRYYMSEEGRALAEEVGYVRLPEKMYQENLKHLE